jgi:hypothetical protein
MPHYEPPVPRVVSACRCISLHVEPCHVHAPKPIYGLWACSCGKSESGYRYSAPEDVVNEFATHVLHNAKLTDVPTLDR